MVSNRLIALALAATLLQAGILSIKLAAAAAEKNARTPAQRFWQSSPSLQGAPAANAALHCPEDNSPSWVQSEWMVAAPSAPYTDASY